MGQKFQLVAPRAKLAVSWYGKLGEMLFDGDACPLVYLLAVPVRRQHRSPRTSPVDTTSTICEENRSTKRERSDDSDDSDAESPRCSKQIKTAVQGETAVSNAPLVFCSLPPEIHRLVFSFIEDIYDVLSLGITSRYFFTIGLECLDNYCASTFGRWAGKNIVCVGDEVQPDDYPPGLFSCEELEVLRRRIIHPYEDLESTQPFNLAHFADPGVSEIDESHSLHGWDTGQKLLCGCVRREISWDRAFHHLSRHLWDIEEERYFPAEEPWILRNLTAKQIVRADAIALSPKHIHGPLIDVLGFGEVVLSRVCWSTHKSVSMVDTTNISRGVWAGHCFDITTLSRHEAETRGEEWTDVSEEVAAEIAGIWEAEFGPDWRDEVCKGQRF
ncbi:hypothetical protein F5Y14DRAFT_417570 [Nemania sp. NC0429]|nr:hypothetical protein F5Y14DRAFT_417570 [Nemania sp. NC0429]